MNPSRSRMVSDNLLPALVVAMLSGVLITPPAQADMVTRTLSFSIDGFFQSLGTPSLLPTGSISGAVAFTYDDSIITTVQDSEVNTPSVFVDAVNLTINNAQNPGASHTYSTSDVKISLLVDAGSFILSDTLGTITQGEPGTDGFQFVFLGFEDPLNVDYLYGNYTVITDSTGLWFSDTGTATVTLGNQLVPLPAALGPFGFALAGLMVWVRRKSA